MQPNGAAREVTRAEVLATIRSHLAAREVDPDVVTESAAFGAEIDVDSLALLTLAQHLEDEFDVRIGEADAAELTTVGQAIDFVLAQRASGG